MPSYDSTLRPRLKVSSICSTKPKTESVACRRFGPARSIRSYGSGEKRTHDLRLLTRLTETIIYPKSWHTWPLDVEYEDVERDVLNFINELHILVEK